jgi:hypothetical protein
MTKMLEEDIRAWFHSRLPEGWFGAPAGVEADGDEILVVGELRDGEDAIETEDLGRGAVPERVQRFREETREKRMRIAQDAERRFGRRVSWGVECGGQRFLFTGLSVPVMTRLRFPERRVLDTLVEAGVARSRSDALAWCVRLVGRHQADWIQELREALVKVGELRRRGPV